MSKEGFSRRGWLTTSLAAGLAAGCVYGGSEHDEATDHDEAADHDSGRESHGRALPAGSVVLFQGDSITDAGRNREQGEANAPRGFGYGYPLLIASELLDRQAEDGLQFYNRGISGDKVPDLDARWQQDAIDLQPTVLSILVGVNDIWHKLNGKYDGTVESYESGFAALLARTREALPATRLVVCQPFVLRTGAVNDSWFPEFDERRAAARRVADGAGAVWVPFQEMFDQALDRAAPEHWARDGVHPSMAGHALMAKTWIETVSGGEDVD